MSKVSVIVPVYNVENYIRDMLLSVQNQTFKDFEVILINDGSPDNSQSIIEEFCRADKRFKCFVQENGGVAAARNNGIQKATGDYLVFYDPDDFVPPNALEHMYKCANKNNADIVFGVMRESSIGERRYNASTIRLGKKKDISKFDKDLLWSFSVCNKMFKKDFIIGNNISFPKIKHAEDAVFLFNAIFKAGKMAGCRKCAYEYKTRPFWEEKSATQTISYEYLKDVIDALDNIEELIKNNISDNSEYFLEEFYSRYLDISLFVRYYRSFWAMDEKCKNLINKKVDYIKNKISESTWRKISSKNLDLQLEKHIFDNKDAKANALLTIIINSNIPKEKLPFVINNIYNQSMPFFNIILLDKYRETIVEEKLYKENMIFVEHIDDNVIDTEFVMFADERFLYSKNSIKAMINSMIKDNRIDFTTVPIKKIKNGELFDTGQTAAFTILQCMNNNLKKYNKLDLFIGNKIFRNSIIDNRMKFDDKFEYGDMCYKKIYNAYFIAVDDASIEYDKASLLPSELCIKIKCKQKRLEDQFMDIAKTYFTKEDIKRIIKKI